MLILMTAAGFMSLLFGFVAFLLDFVELQWLANYRATLTTSLHILAGNVQAGPCEPDVGEGELPPFGKREGPCGIRRRLSRVSPSASPSILQA